MSYPHLNASPDATGYLNTCYFHSKAYCSRLQTVAGQRQSLPPESLLVIRCRARRIG